MAGAFPIKHAIRLARVSGLIIVLSALLATPVECLCGDPYPSAHALLEFILAPRTIVMTDDGMPSMALPEHTAHQQTGNLATGHSSPSTDAGANAPSMDSGMAPSIRDDAEHLERAGGYSAITGLILIALIALTRRASVDSARVWRGIHPQPAIPPPRRLLIIT